LTSGTMPIEQEAAAFSARLLKPYRQSQLFGALARILHKGAVPESVLQAKTVQATGQTILVADDNLVNLKVAVSMLAKLGYESVTVMDGQQATQSVLASLQPGGKRFAAVLMDANMPVMDGFASSRQIIATHGKAAPPIIALTASVLEEDRQRCFDAGMVGFLPKPLRMDELSDSLRQYARHEEAPDSSFATDLVANSSYSLSTNSSISSSSHYQADRPVDTQVDTPTGLPLAEQLLMDWSRLEQFKEFDDDERSMTREVIGLFVQDAPNRRDDILASLNTTDAALLSRRAHALKGAASNVGAVALSEACAVLEHECKKGVWPENAREQIEQIDDLTNQTLLALRQWKL
jgi:CheY-like chemotaxis protein/HPt (histidine-containing phosphotransfer) domain-containing protein